jgi:hypothetical protein
MGDGGGEVVRINGPAFVWLKNKIEKYSNYKECPLQDHIHRSRGESRPHPCRTAPFRLSIIGEIHRFNGK